MRNRKPRKPRKKRLFPAGSVEVSNAGARGRGKSRQRHWQRRKIDTGLCKLCGLPRERTAGGHWKSKKFCEAHREQARVQQRKNRAEARERRAIVQGPKEPHWMFLSGKERKAAMAKHGLFEEPGAGATSRVGGKP